jgi:hypothetical protein
MSSYTRREYPAADRVKRVAKALIADAQTQPPRQASASRRMAGNLTNPERAPVSLSIEQINAVPPAVQIAYWRQHCSELRTNCKARRLRVLAAQAEIASLSGLKPIRRPSNPGRSTGPGRSPGASAEAVDAVPLTLRILGWRKHAAELRAEFEVWGLRARTAEAELELLKLRLSTPSGGGR